MEQSNNTSSGSNSNALMVTVALLIILPLVYVFFVKGDKKDEGKPSSEDIINQAETLKKNAEANPNEANYLNLGLFYYNNKMFRECLTASRKASEINPNSSNAFTNIGAAYNGLSILDSAITASAHALELNPNNQLARNNLVWAKGMQSKSQ